MKLFLFFCDYLHLICKFMALNVIKLCCIRALLTRSKITPEIGYARLAALHCLYKDQKAVSSNPSQDQTQWCLRFEQEMFVKH